MLFVCDSHNADRQKAQFLCSYVQGLTVVNISATTFPQALDWLHNHLLQVHLVSLFYFVDPTCSTFFRFYLIIYKYFRLYLDICFLLSFYSNFHFGSHFFSQKMVNTKKIPACLVKLLIEYPMFNKLSIE